MEIKVECSCGTRYRFDVEPLNGRMPVPVACPACGANGTPQANATIQKLLGALPSAGTPSKPLVARLIAEPAARQTANRPAPLAPLAVPRVSQKPKRNLKAVLVTCATVVVVAFGLWRFGAKWYRRLSAVAEVVQTVSGSNAPEGQERKQNFWQEDCVILFVRHTNHVEIAEACKAFWKERLSRELSVKEALDDQMGEREYRVVGAHNGFIRLIGGLEWPQTDYEGLALELSRRFNTLVLETRDVDFTGAYHFGVYEQGTRKFHAQMDVKLSGNEPVETVTTEGNDWALAQGFKPGPEGFKEFHLGHADEISQKLGLKMWDEKEKEKLAQLQLLEL